MFLAEGATALSIETLSLQIDLANSTVEAFSVPVLPESLDPAIGGFDGEFAAVAFGSEKLIPVLGAIHISVLNVEARGADGRLTMEANEALRMPRLAHGIDAIMFDGAIALGAFGSEVLLVLVLAEELTALFDEADSLKRDSGVRADEILRRERLAKSQDKRTSDLFSAHGADWDFAGENRLLHFGASGRSESWLPRARRNRRHLDFGRCGRRGGCSSGCWGRSGNRFRGGGCDLSFRCRNICSLRGGGVGDILGRVKVERLRGDVGSRGISNLD